MRTGLRTLGAEPRSIIEAPDTLAHWQQNPGSEGRPTARLSRIHTARRCVAQERQIGTGERQMRAMILDAPRRPLRAADIPRPEPGPGQVLLAVAACGVCRTDLHVLDGRSEEHTSELQSPCNLVCRLLLEKKKNIRYDIVLGQNT